MRSGGKPPKSMRELIAAAERSLQKRHMRGGAIEKEYKRQVPVIGGGNVDMEDRVQKRADMVRDFKAGGQTAGGKTAGGKTAGGRTAGGKTAGGRTAGGRTAGGKTAGGKTAGGRTAGGRTAGGQTAGGKRLNKLKAQMKETGAELKEQLKETGAKVKKQVKKRLKKPVAKANELLEQLLEKYGSGQTAGGIVSGTPGAAQPTVGGSKRRMSDKMKRRGALVKKVMKEKGLSLAQASKYVKEKNMKY